MRGAFCLQALFLWLLLGSLLCPVRSWGTRTPRAGEWLSIQHHEVHVCGGLLVAPCCTVGADCCALLPEGDAGGPVTCLKSEHWVLVGVVNWGKGCALPYCKGVYTDVALYSRWIQACLCL